MKPPRVPASAFTLGLVLQLILTVVVLGGVLLGSAGGLRFPVMWVYVGVCATLTVLAGLRMDRGLARERLRPGPSGKDRLFLAVAWPLALMHWTVAGLDVGRFHWSDDVPGSSTPLVFAIP